MTWPDFTCLPNDMTPVLKLVPIEEEEPVETVNGLKITAIRVSHTIPTTGFVVDDGKSVLAFSSDTGPTKHFWENCSRQKRLKAIITECSFPNKLQHIADVSGHVTPQTLKLEMKKLRKKVPVYPIIREATRYDSKFKAIILKKLEKEMKAIDCEELLTMDGFRLQFEDGWALVRPSGTEPNGNSFVFDGKGYGHGVGLCQWSALEMARSGMNYRDILSYFYPGTLIQTYENR